MMAWTYFDVVKGVCMLAVMASGLLPLTTDSEDWQGITARIVLVVVGALMARYLVHFGVNRVVASLTSSTQRTMMRSAAGVLGIAESRRQQRMEAMASLLRSCSTVVLFCLAIIYILDIFRVSVAPLLASASVAGVAVAFGAQNVIKDYLSGIFMIVEDQFGVGDVVEIGDVSGVVEEITLRITRVRDMDGVVWYLRNGEILKVANRSQGWSTAVVDVPVAYNEDAARVLDILEQVAQDAAADEQWSEVFLDPPKVAGVEAIEGDTMIMRMTVKCEANRNVEVSRELRSRIKLALDAAGVRGPLVSRD